LRELARLPLVGGPVEAAGHRLVRLFGRVFAPARSAAGLSGRVSPAQLGQGVAGRVLLGALLGDTVPGAERFGDRGVRFVAPDAVTAYRGFLAGVRLAGTVD